MSLRQERFLNLITAAERLVKRDQILRSHIHRTCSAVASGQISAQEAINDIGLQLRLYPDYDPAEKTIALERQWYDITHRRNDQEAARIARKRAFDSNKRRRKQTVSSHFAEADAINAELEQRMAQDRADLDQFNEELKQQSNHQQQETIMNTKEAAEYQKYVDAGTLGTKRESANEIYLDQQPEE